MKDPGVIIHSGISIIGVLIACIINIWFGLILGITFSLLGFVRELYQAHQAGNIEDDFTLHKFWEGVAWSAWIPFWIIFILFAVQATAGAQMDGGPL